MPDQSRIYKTDQYPLFLNKNAPWISTRHFAQKPGIYRRKICANRRKKICTKVLTKTAICGIIDTVKGQAEQAHRRKGRDCAVKNPSYKRCPLTLASFEKK